MNKQRNRHTGRINAAKGAILTHGMKLQASDGAVYYADYNESGGRKFPTGTWVRDFNAVPGR